MLAAAAALKKLGVEDVYACCTHAVLSGDAASRIREGALRELVVTDSIPVPQHKRNGRITVVSVADLLGEAIHRIHSGLSVGAMFEVWP